MLEENVATILRSLSVLPTFGTTKDAVIPRTRVRKNPNVLYSVIRLDPFNYVVPEEDVVGY